MAGCCFLLPALQVIAFASFAASSATPVRYIGVFAMQRSSSTFFLRELEDAHPCFIAAHEWLMPVDRGVHIMEDLYSSTTNLEVLTYADRHFDTVVDRHCPAECNRDCIMIIKLFNHHVKQFSLYESIIKSPSMIPIVLKRHNDTAHACSTFHSFKTHDYHITPEEGFACPEVSASALQHFIDTKRKWYDFLEKSMRPRLSLALSFEANVNPVEFNVTKNMLLRLANFDLQDF